MMLRLMVTIGLLGGCGFEGNGASIDAAVDAATDAGVDAPGDRCPSSYEVVAGAPAGSRYRKLNIARTATELAAECAADRTHLVVIDNAQENAAMESYAPKRNGYFIVGLSDSAVEGTWITAKQQLATYLPWGRLQPDGGLAQNCVLQTGGLFYDYFCNTQWPSVCECD